ncbi:MAG: FHA domain-containing protein, partial [Xanthomonas sp.]
MFTVLINTPGGDTRQVKCMHRECGIGRADANLVMLQGWNIAGKHATLLREDEGVFILPLGGREPITLNGKVVLAKQGPIDGKDEIRIGQYMLKVSGDDARIVRQTPA